jgi:imidazolonepropionase
MLTLIKNIKKLVGVQKQPNERLYGSQMSQLETIKDAYLLIKDKEIEDFGQMSALDSSLYNNVDKQIDASGKMVFPSFCDSHTHSVYAGSREIEYIDKIKGLSYEEIAKRGGGILNSAKRLQQTSEEDLYQDAMLRLNQMIAYGTGAVEIKSGYGMDTVNELKMLRVIKRLKETSPLTIKSTLLGAHGVPMEYRGRQGEFVDMVCREMIPAAAKEGLADFVDVFCDKGFFTVEETDKMLKAGKEYGLTAKIHANELDYSGGIQCAVANNALSCDHLEYVGEKEIACLKDSPTEPTILPGAAFFLNMPLSPARKMIESGLSVAMASDCNPGSSPSCNMQLIVSFACVNYRLVAAEAINATTINSAYAMGLSCTHGSITKGKIANFYITKPIPTVEYMPYSYGENKVETPFLNGVAVQVRA